MPGARLDTASDVALRWTVLPNATVPMVKAFAQKTIEAHTASTAKLKAIAASGTPGITPDGALTADQQTTLDALKASSAKAFDQAYTKSH